MNTAIEVLRFNWPTYNPHKHCFDGEATRSHFGWRDKVQTFFLFWWPWQLLHPASTICGVKPLFVKVSNRGVYVCQYLVIFSNPNDSFLIWSGLSNGLVVGANSFPPCYMNHLFSCLWEMVVDGHVWSVLDLSLVVVESSKKIERGPCIFCA